MELRAKTKKLHDKKVISEMERSAGTKRSASAWLTYLMKADGFINFDFIMPRSKEFGYLRSFANKSGQHYVDLCYFSWKRENPYLNYDTEKLFSLRRRFQRKELIKKEIDYAINYLARKNNTEELSRNESPCTPHLEFDLHNFTCNGALDYVREIVQKMRKAEKRLVHGDETIVLITGKGYGQDENESTIKNELLEEYQGQIKVDKKNAGRLNLTLKRKMVYANCIPADFFF